MKQVGTRANHGWILILLGAVLVVLRTPYDLIMSLVNGTILIISGITVVIGQYRDPEARTCQVCAATVGESKLGPKTNALPLIFPVILLIITPLISVETSDTEDWIDTVVGERWFEEIPENRTQTNLFELVNFGEKYDRSYVEVNGSILQRRNDGFQMHQYVPLCTCCPPVEVTMWVYFPLQCNPDYKLLVEDAELGKTRLFIVIGQFFYDGEQDFASILLIHIEPLDVD